MLPWLGGRSLGGGSLRVQRGQWARAAAAWFGTGRTGSPWEENLTGKRVTGFSVRDSDVFHNMRHEWKCVRRYQGAVKCIILDWAGTVMDCGVFAPVVAMRRVFEREGVPVTEEETRKPMGTHKRVHIGRIMQMPTVRQRWTEAKGAPPTEADVERLFRSFVPEELAVLPQYLDIMPGVVETVRNFKKWGIKIGSTTGFTSEVVERLRESARRQGYEPDAYVAADDVPQARPFPFMVWLNAIRLEVSPVSSIVKVDDTLEGVREGTSAGCWSVGVARTGNYMGKSMQELEDLQRNDPHEYERRLSEAYEELSHAGAHYVVDSVNELPRVIDDINRRLAMGEVP